MSFKDFSTTHGVPAKEKPDDKSKAAPAADLPVAQPSKTPAEVAPASKS